MFKKSIILFIFIIIGLGVFSQNMPKSVDEIAGQWFNGNYNLHFTINSNFTYSFKYNNNESNGVWRFQNGQLCCQDSSNGVITCYWVVKFSKSTMTLQDNNGAILEYIKQNDAGKEVVGFIDNSKTKKKILAEKSGVRFSQYHIDALSRFLQFITGEKLSDKQKSDLLKAELKGFDMNPKSEIATIESIDNAMKVAYKSKDWQKVAMVKMELFSTLYSQFMKIPKEKRPFFALLMEDLGHILVFDQNTGIVLTQNAASGFVNYLLFMQKISGMNINFNQNLETYLLKEVKNNFLSFPQETKKAIAGGDIIWQITQYNWSLMTEQQKLQVQQQANGVYNSTNFSTNMFGSQNGDVSGQANSFIQQTQGLNSNRNQIYNNINTNSNGSSQMKMAEMQRAFNARQACFKIMNDTSLMQHATSLNIIENIGNTGNYWEVKDYPGY